MHAPHATKTIDKPSACSLSLAWYESAMMESKVVYRLQKYSWKEHLTPVQEISVEICNL